MSRPLPAATIPSNKTPARRIGRLDTVLDRKAIRDHITLIPMLHGGAMQRHPGLVHGQDVLRAGDRIDNATAGKQVPDRQRAAEWGRRQFVKDAANAERTSKRPAVLRLS